ncbi:right-handed parallel beta-helix repeat-containing protein [Planctomycetota bacterium]
MKKLKNISFYCLVIWYSLAILGCSAEDSKFFVALDGSDDNPGTISEPLATVQKAANVMVSGDTCYIRSGTYLLEDSINLGSTNSGDEGRPITYRPYRDEEVILTGAVELDPDDFEVVTDTDILDRLPARARGKVVQIDLAAAGITDYGQIQALAGNTVPEAELIFNNRVMHLARWPNMGFAYTGNVIQRGSETEPSIFGYDSDRPERWNQADDIWMLGFWWQEWRDDSVQVASIDTTNKTIQTVSAPNCFGRIGILSDKRYYYFNLLEEIDTPGEFYIARTTGILYFYPPDELQGNRIQLTVLDEPLLTMSNVSNVIVESLTFEATRDNAISVAGGSNNLFAGCTIRNTGRRAASVQGGSDIGFKSCDIYGNGDGGLSLGGAGDIKTLTPGKLFADNNHIYNWERRTKMYAAPINISSVGNIVSHNLMHGSWHSAIAFSGNDHLITYNEIHNIIKYSNDSAAAYSGRGWTRSGTEIKHNFIHHIHGIPTHDVIGIGVYPDDGLSGIYVTGNVFYDIDMAFFSHGGRGSIVKNNMIIDCYRSISFMDPTLVNWWDSRYESLLRRLDGVPYDDPDGPYAKYPHLKTLIADLQRLEQNPDNEDYKIPKDNSAVRNFLYDTNDIESSDNIVTYGAFEDNLMFDMSQDPGFIDYDNMNFALSPDSIVYEQIQGFEEIPFEQIGLYTDQYRKTLPTLGEFRLHIPADGATDVDSMEVEFVWQSSLYADRYKLQIATDDSFTDVVHTRTVIDECLPYASTTVKGLDSAATYYWKVKAISDSRSMNLDTTDNVGGPYSFTTSEP